MIWILFGFLSALGIETFIRLANNYERSETRPVRKVQVSMPWYGWTLSSYAILKAKKKR